MALVYVDPLDLKHQVLKNKHGTRLEVNCPLCGETVVQRIEDEDDLDVEFSIELALGNHLALCQPANSYAVDLIEAIPRTDTALSNDGIIFDQLAWGPDGRLWHFVSGRNSEDEVFYELEQVVTEQFALDYELEEKERQVAIVFYQLEVLKQARSLNSQV